jgi:ATP-binding cassette subfamily B protein
MQEANLAWLGGYVRRHQRAAIASLVAGFVAGAATSLEPYLAGVVIDEVRQGWKAAALLPTILLMLLLGGVAVVGFWYQRHFSGIVAYAVTFDIRKTLFENLLTRENAFYQHYATGDLIARMRGDLDVLWRLVALTFTRLGSAVFTLGLTFVLLATISLPLTLVVFVVLGISTAVQARLGLSLARVFEQVQAQDGVMSAFAQDAFSGIQTIKTFGSEAEASERYRAANREYRRRWIGFKRRNEPVGMLPNMIAELTAGVVVVFGGILALNQQLSLGDFTRFLISLNLITAALLQLAMMYQRAQQARGALTRLTPLLQAADITDVRGETETSAPVLGAARDWEFRGEITFENVGVRGRNDGGWLLHGVSLYIPAGRVVGFAGATGSGKTLLLSLIARIIDPDEGRVLLDGQDVRTLPLDALRSAIAYVPQATFLFSMPLHENIRLGRGDLEEDELARALHISRMRGDLEQLPFGLETMVGEKGVMLSGGQKQRVAIARAIVRDPAVLILDDALSSVDTHTASEILADLRQVLRTRTSLIVAQRMSTLKDADWIIVMQDGRIAEQGTHDTLAATNGLYSAMLNREREAA